MGVREGAQYWFGVREKQKVENSWLRAIKIKIENLLTVVKMAFLKLLRLIIEIEIVSRIETLWAIRKIRFKLGWRSEYGNITQNVMVGEGI